VSKELAAVALGQSTSLTAASFGVMRLGLVFNEGAAGGIWLGDHTRLLNILSMALAALVAGAATRHLGAVHRIAPIALGLIVGGALGNTISLILRPGVIDFLAFDVGSGNHVVINLADVATFAGVCALMPVGVTIISQIVVSRRERTLEQVAPVLRRSVFELEVPIALASEVHRAEGTAADTVPTRATVTEDVPRTELRG
jgi:signal peptidase II